MNEKEPTTYEIACLAAKFLPPMEVPENWLSEDPVTLSNLLQTESKPDEYGPHSESPWELLCNQAVTRAKILLDYAAGKLRPEVIDFQEAEQRCSELVRDGMSSGAKWKEKFGKIAKGRESIPKIDALAAIVPSARKETLLKYYEYYLQEGRKKLLKEDPDLPLLPLDMKEQLSADLNAQKFSQLAKGFSKAHGERKEAWKKQRLRETGKLGGRKTQKMAKKKSR